MVRRALIAPLPPRNKTVTAVCEQVCCYGEGAGGVGPWCVHNIMQPLYAPMPHLVAPQPECRPLLSTASYCLLSLLASTLASRPQTPRYWYVRESNVQAVVFGKAEASLWGDVWTRLLAEARQKVAGLCKVPS